jgi:hypothetical protein
MSFWVLADAVGTRNRRARVDRRSRCRPVSHNSASEAIGQLQELGYNVQVNVVNGPRAVGDIRCAGEVLRPRALQL